MKPLKTLTDEVNELHWRILTSLESTIQLYKQAGDLLRAIKKQVGHGKWQSWLEKNFKASEETARGYMRVSKNWKYLNNGKFATLTAALDALRIGDKQPTKQERTASWARKQLRKAFEWEVKRWTDEEVLYLSEHCTFGGRLSGLLDEKLHDIREEIKPDVAKYVKERETQTERYNFVGLVACGKGKKKVASEARTLYTGHVPKAGSKWMDANCQDWFILSAEHGLLPPGQKTEPYNTFLKDLSRDEKAKWADEVIAKLPRNRPILYIGGKDYLKVINKRSTKPLPIINMFEVLSIMDRFKRPQWFKENPVLTDELATTFGVKPPA